jgi:hypothetical protein
MMNSRLFARPSIAFFLSISFKKDKMKRTFITLAVLFFLALLVNNAAARQDLLQSVADGCKQALKEVGLK